MDQQQRQNGVRSEVAAGDVRDAVIFPTSDHTNLVLWREWHIPLDASLVTNQTQLDVSTFSVFEMVEQGARKCRGKKHSRARPGTQHRHVDRGRGQ